MRYWVAIFLTGLVVSLTAGSVMSAPHLDRSELYSGGAWRVELTVDTDGGDLWCSASTRNRAGQSFDLTLYDSGRIALFVTDPRWDLAQRDVSFGLDVDGGFWRLRGRAQGTSIGAALPSGSDAVELLERISVGRRATLINNRRLPVANFALQGGDRAFVELYDCASKISDDHALQVSADPF
ncbi:hypothetical protein [Qingshengfaniella alkalisoli]|uniref:Uncharacterized protein n=1 Tax=Qingshengfaniella alkalisoli TaxID=2599296 RepID=A0A5B8IVC2_9RHOB|nr:hypothetical protein [Qingshengfaniella alkalisoli]QDY69393.1 hypothetical protein FPZ52_06985 [Qingshengfaniella alkalisoli]